MDTTRLQRLSRAYMESAAFIAAVELKLFTAVAGGDDTEAHLPGRLGLTPGNTQPLVTPPHPPRRRPLPRRGPPGLRASRDALPAPELERVGASRRAPAPPRAARRAGQVRRFHHRGRAPVPRGDRLDR